MDLDHRSADLRDPRDKNSFLYINLPRSALFFQSYYAIPIWEHYSGIKASFLAQLVSLKTEIRMMNRMSFLSWVFRSRKELSKEVKETEEGEEEEPCTSYSQRGEDKRHRGHLESEILSEYKAKSRASKETLALPQFIQLEEERSSPPLEEACTSVVTTLKE